MEIEETMIDEHNDKVMKMMNWFVELRINYMAGKVSEEQMLYYLEILPSWVEGMII